MTQLDHLRALVADPSREREEFLATTLCDIFDHFQAECTCVAEVMDMITDFIRNMVLNTLMNFPKEIAAEDFVRLINDYRGLMNLHLDMMILAAPAFSARSFRPET